MNVWASLVAQTVKNMPAMQNTRVRSLGGRSPGEGNGYPYLTCCNPTDCSPPGSSVHGILQARILEWAACPPPGDLPDTGIELSSLTFPALVGRFFTPSTTYRAYHTNSNFTHKYLPKRNKKIHLNREVCINVHSSFIQNSIKLETIQMNK